MRARRSGMAGAAATAWLAGLAIAARAEPPLAVPALAATCAACHGTQGHAIDGATVPGLAGLPAGYLAEQMKGFKEGNRQATVMNQIAKGYSQAQIEQLAAFFAAQRK